MTVRELKQLLDSVPDETEIVLEPDDEKNNGVYERLTAVGQKSLVEEDGCLFRFPEELNFGYKVNLAFVSNRTYVLRKE